MTKKKKKKSISQICTKYMHNQQIRKAKDCQNTPLVQSETLMIGDFRVEGNKVGST